MAKLVRIQGGNRQHCQVFVLADIFLKSQSSMYYIILYYVCYIVMIYVFFLFIIMADAILVFLKLNILFTMTGLLLICMFYVN